MQYRDEADARPEMLGIGRDRQCGLGRRLEQQVVDHRLILVRDVAQRSRQRVDHTKVWHRQQLGLALGQPLACGGALTLGTVPVAARIIGNERVRAVLAARDMAAEYCRAAALDSRHHFQLVEADVASICLTPRCPVVAEDIRDLQRWTGHLRRRLRRRLVFLAPLLGFLRPLTLRLRQPVKRALDGRDRARGDVKIARRGLQFFMTQEHLDLSDIRAAIEQMGGEAVAQRMHRHAFLDPRSIGRFVE